MSEKDQMGSGATKETSGDDVGAAAPAVPEDAQQDPAAAEAPAAPAKEGEEAAAAAADDPKSTTKAPPSSIDDQPPLPRESVVAPIPEKFDKSQLEVQKMWRRVVWRHTDHIVSTARGYVNHKHRWVPISIPMQLAAQVHVVVPPRLGRAHFQPRFVAGNAAESGGEGGSTPRVTKVKVVNGDCIDVAIEMVRKRGLNPIMMDAASRTHFGGGYQNGARAQEEDLCRRSTLAFLVDPKLGLQAQTRMYPLPAEFGVYVPGVQFFRAGAHCHYRVLEAPVTCAVGAVAAANRPPLNPETKRMGDDVVEQLRGAILSYFRMAYDNGHDAVICIALGCGAFQNPARHVAEIFASVARDFIPDGCFKEVVFAVMDDHNAYHANNPDGNFTPFEEMVRREFGGEVDRTGETLVFDEQSELLTYDAAEVDLWDGGAGREWDDVARKSMVGAVAAAGAAGGQEQKVQRLKEIVSKDSCPDAACRDCSLEHLLHFSHAVDTIQTAAIDHYIETGIAPCRLAMGCRHQDSLAHHGGAVMAHPCKYGKKCYRQNEEHRATCYHPVV